MYASSRNLMFVVHVLQPFASSWSSLWWSNLCAMCLSLLLAEVLIEGCLLLLRIPYQNSRFLRTANQMHDE